MAYLAGPYTHAAFRQFIFQIKLPVLYDTVADACAPDNEHRVRGIGECAFFAYLTQHRRRAVVIEVRLHFFSEKLCISIF